MKASENGHVGAVKVLSEKGAELNLQNGVSSGDDNDVITIIIDDITIIIIYINILSVIFLQ